VDLDEPAIYESPEHEPRLRALVLRQGRLGRPNAIDYFVFRWGLFANFPQFAIGRPWWDNWFLWKARKLNAALVDASGIVLAVHQNHDYSLPDGSQDVMQCEEARQNYKLAGRGFRTIEDATHKLTPDGIKYDFWHLLIPAKRAVLRWWWALLRITGPVRHPLGLRREDIVNMLGRIGLLSSRSSTKPLSPRSGSWCL